VDFFDVVGRLTAVVFAHRRNTAVARRLYPKTPPTPAQKQARIDWAATDAAWQALDDARKQAWRDWQPWKPLYGYSLFMKWNYPRYRAGLPLYLDPPW
jgi:hypothetical protein